MGWEHGAVAKRRLSALAVSGVALATVAISLLESNATAWLLVRAIISFVAITFLPGYAVLSLLGVERSSGVRVVLYSVGISLPYVVSLVIVADLVLSSVGLDRRLVASGLVALLAVGTLVPALVAWMRGTSVGAPPSARTLFEIRDWPGFSLLALLPFLGVLGAHLVDAYDATFVVLALLFLVACVPSLIAFGSIPRHLYPFAVVSASLAVLFHTTLVTEHIWGWDIHYEYYTARIIRDVGWNVELRTIYNSLPTATLLAAIYSSVSGVPLVWVYKVFYPILITALPLGMFALIRRVDIGSTDARLAALAPFVFVFYYGFFKDMPDKQMLAELYVVLLLLVLFDADVDDRRERLLLLIFSVGLVFSHYAISLFFLLFVTFAYTATRVFERTGRIDSLMDRVFRPSLVVALAALWVGWYGFVADGIIIDRAVDQFVRTVLQLSDLFASRSGADYAISPFSSPLWLVYMLAHVALLGLVSTGILRATYAAWTGRSNGRTVEFTALSVGVFGFLLSSVGFTFGMGFDRTLQLSLAVLAPFALLGWRTCFSLLSRVADAPADWITSLHVVGAFAVFLGIFFLLSSGAAFAVADQEVPPYSIGLDEDAGWPVYHESEVRASRWLESATPADEEGVAVYNRWETIKSRDGLLVSEVVDRDRIVPVWSARTSLSDVRYVYVSHKPMTELGSQTEYVDPERTPFYDAVLRPADRIYANGRASIYVVNPREKPTARTPTGTVGRFDRHQQVHRR